MYNPLFLKKVKNYIFRKNNWSSDFVESEPLPFSGVIHNKLDDKLVFFFSYFSQKTGCDISWKLSILFSGKK